MINIKNYLYLVAFVLIFSFLTSPFLVNDEKSLNQTSVSYKVVKGDNL